MYCECKKQFPIDSSAGGKPFKVCAKRLGGCGKEIVEKKYQHKTIETDIVNCTKCNGTGQIRQAYSIYSGGGTSRCDKCNGYGLLANSDDDDYGWRD
jgi:DnaJ-class molecular chaperone